MFADHGHRAERRPERQRPHVSHKDRGRIGVEPEKSQARSQNGGRKDGNLSGAFDVRD